MIGFSSWSKFKLLALTSSFLFLQRQQIACFSAFFVTAIGHHCSEEEFAGCAEEVVHGSQPQVHGGGTGVCPQVYAPGFWFIFGVLPFKHLNRHTPVASSVGTHWSPPSGFHLAP